MSEIIKTTSQFLAWLFSLKLPREPKFASKAEKDEWVVQWEDALKNEDAWSFAAIKTYLLPTLKWFPTVGDVLKVANEIRKPAQKTWDEVQTHFKWRGKDIVNPFTVATKQQLEAIRNHPALGRTSRLPVINLDTGAVFMDGKFWGNVEDETFDKVLPLLKKKYEERKHH